jgi:hypothetical protein
MLHEVIDILAIIAISLSGFGLVLSILSLVLPNCKHRDRYMYFGARLLVGSVIVTLTSLVLLRYVI